MGIQLPNSLTADPASTESDRIMRMVLEALDIVLDAVERATGRRIVAVAEGGNVFRLEEKKSVSPVQRGLDSLR